MDASSGGRKSATRPIEVGNEVVQKKSMDGRGGKRAGAGAPAKYDATMKTHSVRMTDEQWEDAKLVGWDWIRAQTSKRAAKIRSET